MHILLKQGIQLFIVVYGGVFIHLAVFLINIPNQRDMYKKISFLLFDFGIMCLSGGLSLFWELKNIPINFIVYISLVALAPLGLDFLLGSLNLCIERKKELSLVRLVSGVVASLGGVLFFLAIPSNIVYAIGYFFLALIFTLFLVLEIGNYRPLKKLCIELMWFFLIVSLNILLILAMMLVQLSGKIDLMPPFWVIVILSVFSIVLLFFRHPEIFAVLEVESQKQRYLHPRLTHTESEKLKNKLEVYMENNQPFLDFELRLSDLAKAIDTSPHSLSEIINTNFNCGYVQFVNKYRIRLACKELLSNKEKTILAIAFDSGFNSKSTFNNAFKEITGITPSEFRREKRPIKDASF